MAHIVPDRGAAYTTTEGTITYVLSATVPASYQGINALLANADTVDLCVFDLNGTGWEVGKYTRSSSNNFARTEIYAGSNGTSAVDWPPGTRMIIAVVPAKNAEFLNQLEASVTSAATTDIGAPDTGRILISGATGPIASFGTQKNKLRIVRFDSTPTLTHSSTLVLPYAADIVAVAGDVAIFSSDNTATPIWRCISWMPQKGYRLGSVQTFAASGTWTKPAGCRAVLVRMVGGGAGGGSADSAAGGSASGGGGGAGGYAEEFITSLVNATEAVTIGAAGLGGVFGGAAAENGGTTSFAAYCTATGGTAGGAGVTGTAVGLVNSGGAGGVGTSSNINARGGQGGSSFRLAATTIVSGYGGNSAWGSGGAARSTTIGLAGSGLGAGGSGGASSNDGAPGGMDGGNGTIGYLIVHEYY